jgi:hypothetical protein
MLGEEEGLGSDDDLSFSESEFLRKRNPKDGGE